MSYVYFRLLFISDKVFRKMIASREVLTSSDISLQYSSLYSLVNIQYSLCGTFTDDPSVYLPMTRSVLLPRTSNKTYKLESWRPSPAYLLTTFIYPKSSRFFKLFRRVLSLTPALLSNVSRLGQQSAVWLSAYIHSVE